MHACANPHAHVCEQLSQIHDYVALSCVAVFCSVLQGVAVCCSVLQCFAGCRSVLQCVAIFCSVLQRSGGISGSWGRRKQVLQCVLQCVVVCCSILPVAAVCCSRVAHIMICGHAESIVLRRVAACCSALQPRDSICVAGSWGRRGAAAKW